MRSTVGRRSASCRRSRRPRPTRTGGGSSRRSARARVSCWLRAMPRGARTPEREIVGTAQLLLATRPNALHRAEVAKVIVHTKVRRRGIGHALMLAVEERARRLGRTTLVLDTRQGDPSERLYTSVGYRLAGAIPAYAKSADGALDPSAFYYRLLTEGGPS